MSTVHVHIGQCGNQIGREFWLKLSSAAKYDDNARRAFFTRNDSGEEEGHIRAVFVDSEKKVLKKIVKHGKPKKNSGPELRLGRSNIVSSAKGCGSNWSMGYHQLPEESVSKNWDVDLYSYTHDFDYGNDNSILKATMEAVRREVEACDCFSGFILWHSLGGGTGSGFGSRLSSALRDRYPLAYQMNVAISPLASGESPMQSYNEVLSIASLQQDSDAIILFENDEVIHLIESRKTGNVASFDEMNSYIAECMLNVLMPVSSLSPPNGPTVGIEPWELVRSVAPMHQVKFLHCSTLSEAKSKQPASSVPGTWNGLCNKHCQQLRSRFLKTKSFADYDDSALAAVCICRNSHMKNQRHLQLDIAKVASKVKNSLNCTRWNPFPVDIWVDEGKPCKGEQKHMMKSVTTCSNLSSFGAVHCKDILRSAKPKFGVKAYLHWFKRYGTTETDFEEAFDVVESIVDEYLAAAR